MAVPAGISTAGQSRFITTSSFILVGNLLFHLEKTSSIRIPMRNGTIRIDLPAVGVVVMP
jgi:hypothetical protein